LARGSKTKKGAGHGTNLVATSTYGYNGVGSITSLSYDKGGTKFASYTWSYDNDQRLTSDSLPDGTDSFTYDAASQITAATHSYQTNESYSYDANGNRTNTGYRMELSPRPKRLTFLALAVLLKDGWPSFLFP
jgi:YD repeat-containing protein